MVYRDGLQGWRVVACSESSSTESTRVRRQRGQSGSHRLPMWTQLRNSYSHYFGSGMRKSIGRRTPTRYFCRQRRVKTLDNIYELSPGARKMSRGYLLTFCPFHQDDSPSLLVFEDGWFRCKGAECGRTGRLETLYDALVSPSAAPNGRAEHARGRPPWLPKAGDTEAIARLVWDAHNVLLRNESFRWYLEMRGVADRVETAGLGWHEGWITIPILTDDRQVQGVVLRATKLTQKMTGMRFVQLTGQRPMLYCPDWALVNKGGGALFVVFGMFDALALSSLRFPVVTTTGG